MTEFTAQNPQDKKTEKQFSSITPGISVSTFLNYKPIDSKDQGYNANRGGLPHYSIDYGSNAGITKGSTILAVQGGEATPQMKWYTNSKTRTTDAGVQIRSKDPRTGKDVYTTYGHLSQASVAAMFPGGRSRTVKAGEKIGEVGTTGKAANNEYHVHVDVIDANPVDRFGRSRKNGAHTGKYSHNPLDYFKGVAKATETETETSENNTNRDSLSTQIPSTSQNPVTPSTTALTGTVASSTALTGTVARNTTLTGTIPDQSTQIPSTGTTTTPLTGTVPSSTALTGIVPSNTALTGTVPSSTELTGIVPSNTALTGTVPSNTALTGTVPNSTALTGTVSSSTALTGIAGGGKSPQSTQLQQGMALS